MFLLLLEDVFHQFIGEDFLKPAVKTCENDTTLRQTNTFVLYDSLNKHNWLYTYRLLQEEISHKLCY